MYISIKQNLMFQTRQKSSFEETSLLTRGTSTLLLSYLRANIKLDLAARIRIKRQSFIWGKDILTRVPGPRLDHLQILSFFTLSPSHQFLDTCMEH